MPIYEYLCQKCGEFEVTQKIKDKPLDVCPTCGQGVKKLISNSTFKLMGTGWYLTDYARKGQNSEGAQPVNSQSKSDGKADTSSDTKSESKTDTKKETSTEQKPANQKGSASTAS
jgi:putative FmdB family regulatory protein